MELKLQYQRSCSAFCDIARIAMGCPQVAALAGTAHGNTFHATYCGLIEGLKVWGKPYLMTCCLLRASHGSHGLLHLACNLKAW